MKGDSRYQTFSRWVKEGEIFYISLKLADDVPSSHLSIQLNYSKLLTIYILLNSKILHCLYRSNLDTFTQSK